MDKCCSIVGCTRKYYAKDLCALHYQRRLKRRELTKPIETRSSTSRQCLETGCQNLVTLHGGHNRCPRHNKKYLQRIRKQKLVELLGNRCSKCGCQFPFVAYDFHHKDPTTKVFGIAESMLNISMDELLTELVKCELLCANCHRIHHYGDYDGSL